MLHNSISHTKVFSIDRFNKSFETAYRFTIVVYGCVESENTRNLKLHNLVVAVYCRGERVGSAGYRPSKVITVSKKSLQLASDVVTRLKNDAIQDAYRTVLSRGQVFNATVLWFRFDGQGYVDVHGVGHVLIHGCNAFNALTWYDETSCISLEKGQVISCSLADMGTHLTVINYTGNFDQEQSDKLDHSKLAFKKKNGKIVSGLFA